MNLILASQSSTRRAMLEAAGVTFDAMTPGVDEESAKASLRAQGLSARDLADALAELKALRLSQRIPGALVLGSDQTLALDDGTMLDKAADRATAAEQLGQLSGRTHSLYSAAVIAENGRAVWRHVDRARLTVRPLSDAFIDEYLDAEFASIAGSVGCYRVEGRGGQLFSRIEGSHFTILGLPLLPLLDYLRTRGLLTS
ncbi:Maf family protein [Sphingomonas cavernae]|uniref:Nucleoside triphosphate pyrophosphatase n=1 Tax=Sphingomonas cavernae TaxID=2320861 RepID=A0A418WR74_9SPHN|nr:nucleoside triphosphate pyrophosphatase [Sphingomonas cavernae]RJF93727.1 septum formation protein Maf [Sphingomonas cavernae]